jgi:UDP:flavonoid glycosyltransferase YjiC (YdhE family)
MAIIGTICPNVPGHLNPMSTLCRELQRRGHRVILLSDAAGGRENSRA